MPEHSSTEIVRLVKSVMAKIFAEHLEVKKKLWDRKIWGDGYFVLTTGKFTSENVIREYIKLQGERERI